MWWIMDLKFLDGYASNFSRCVDMQGDKLHDLKSHDYHIITDRFLLVALREMLPTNVWKTIIEMS